MCAYIYSDNHIISIHYIWPRCCQKERGEKEHKLVSALQHPGAVEEELNYMYEIKAGRVRGPFLEPPLPNFRTSGLRVVPKKNGKWRVIPQGLPTP